MLAKEVNFFERLYRLQPFFPNLNPLLMKQLLLSLFLFVALTDQTLTAQITTAQIKARFGIEADLRANFYFFLPASK